MTRDDAITLRDLHNKLRVLPRKESVVIRTRGVSRAPSPGYQPDTPPAEGEPARGWTLHAFVAHEALDSRGLATGDWTYEGRGFIETDLTADDARAAGTRRLSASERAQVQEILGRG